MTIRTAAAPHDPRIASQIALAGCSLGFDHACGRTVRKCSESPASRSYCSSSMTNRIRPSRTSTSSSPGCVIGSGPLSPNGSSDASAPATQKGPYLPEMFSSTRPCLDVNRRLRSSRRIIVTGLAESDSSTKKPTLLPSAAAIFIRLAIVGVMPFFSILCTAAVDSPERPASWASDQPRSARALASLAPISETVRSISGGALGDDTWCSIEGDFYDSARPEQRQSAPVRAQFQLRLTEPGCAY